MIGASFTYLLFSTLIPFAFAPDGFTQSTHEHQQPAFEVAAIKTSPGIGGCSKEVAHGRLTMRYCRIATIIAFAYDMPDFQVSVPDWGSQTRFDIFAKASSPVAHDQIHLMLRTLLAERFKLTVHHEARPAEVQVITVGKNGPRLTPSDRDGPMELQHDRANGRVTFTGATIGELAAILSQDGTNMLDRTGLEGRYDFVLDYSRLVDPSQRSRLQVVFDGWREAIRTQLGLKIEWKKAPLDTLVVDHLEKIPTEN